MLRLAILLLAIAPNSFAAERSSAVVTAFKRENPCPVNGSRRGPCAGWVVDHIKPLCAGGPDHPSNLQWQTVADAKRKDVQERRLCKSIKR